MKMLTNLLGRSLHPYITFIGIFCLPCLVFAIEPIGTIGQPLPEQHAFLSDSVILRVVPTHIQIINTGTGAVIAEFGERTGISEVVLSPTATHLAILNYAVDAKVTTIHIWDVNAHEQVSEWWVTARLNEVAAFSAKTPLFAAAFEDKIYLWNWQTGKFVGKMMTEEHSRAYAIIFSSDGRHLITTSRDIASRETLELWNVETRRLETYFNGYKVNGVEDIVMSPNGTRIATFQRDSNSVFVWDVETRQLSWRERSGTGRISDLVFSPDSQRLYVATRTGILHSSGPGPWEGWDDQIRAWDVESGQQINAFGSEFRFLDKITVSPDGKTALLHYRDAVVLWDIKAKRSTRVWADFIYGWNDALSANGKTFVSVSQSFIKTWDIPSRQMQHLIPAEDRLFRELAISSDGQKLAIGRDPWIEVYNLQTGKVDIQYPYYYGYSDIAFSSSGRWVAARGGSFIHLFDVENPETIQRISSREGPDVDISSLFTFSQNDEYLAATTRTNNNQQYWIVLWKRKGDTFNFQYSWRVPELYSHSRLDFTSDADGSVVLLVPTRTQNTQIWRLLPDNPLLLTTLPVGASARFSADSRYLFADQDNTLQIWDWQAEAPTACTSISDYFDMSRDGAILLSYAETAQIQIWDGKALLSSQPATVEPCGKQIVIFGEVKRNQLLQNFPNPFNPETWIPFRIANQSDVTIRIYSPTGQLVRRLSSGTLPAGDYSSQTQAVYWDGRNQTGEPVSSGVYLYTINAGDFSATRKMLIRK